MTKLNLTYVNRTQRVAKATGKPFTSLSIKATQYGERFISGFGNKDNADWKVGDEVEVKEVTKKMVGDKEYLNVEMIKKEDVVNVEMLRLSQKIDQALAQGRAIIDHLSGKNRLDLTSNGTKVPDFSEVDEPTFDERDIPNDF